MADKFRDTSLVVKVMGLIAFVTLVSDENSNALVQKCLFAQAFGQFFKTVNCRLKNAGIGAECNFGSAFFGRAGMLKRSDGDSRLKLHLVRLAVAPDL